MEWLNEPASWQRTGDVLTVSVDPGTDFWRETGYGYIRDSGHVYGELLAGDLDVSVRLRCSLGVQYDQAGVMLRADERTWLKTGVEFFEGRARLSTVLTLGRSSWMVTDLPEGTDDIVLRVSRRGDAVEVRYVIEEGPAELAALVFLPPGREVLAGVMAAAPEGPGFRVTFHDLRITERDWAAGPDDPAWQDEPAGWAGAAAPAWSPADGEPGWPVPETAEDAPDWPAAAGEAAAPAWPVPVPGDEEPEWQAPAGEHAEPGWAAGAEELGWPEAGAGDGEPGWAPPAADTTQGPEHPIAAAPVPGDSGDPAGPQLTEPEPAEMEFGGPEPAAPGLPEPEPELPEPELPEPEPAGPQTEASGTAEPGPAGTAGPEDAGDSGGPREDPAADWERLAAGVQAAQAIRWSAQADAEVANEWPGPPLRTAMRNGLLADDATPRPAAAADDAQTDPGLPRTRPADPAEDHGPATEEPGEPGDSAGPGLLGTAPGEPGASATEPAAAGKTVPDPAGPVPSARETRRARSKRAAADLPAEPDAADEWISLLTAADPED
jgi:uncharacterized protein